MAQEIKNLKFPGIIRDSIMSGAQAYNSIEHCELKRERYKTAATFCLGFLFGGFIGFCGAWIIFATLNGGG